MGSARVDSAGVSVPQSSRSDSGQNTNNHTRCTAGPASAIRIADIVITDDALGTNNLSLAGADAANFEIVGKRYLERVTDYLTGPYESRRWRGRTLWPPLQNDTEIRSRTRTGRKGVRKYHLNGGAFTQ